jgi:hypothetical protein
MKRPAEVQRTYHTRISDPDGTLNEVLGGDAEVYGRAERALFAEADSDTLLTWFDRAIAARSVDEVLR